MLQVWTWPASWRKELCGASPNWKPAMGMEVMKSVQDRSRQRESIHTCDGKTMPLSLTIGQIIPSSTNLRGLWTRIAWQGALTLGIQNSGSLTFKATLWWQQDGIFSLSPCKKVKSSPPSPPPPRCSTPWRQDDNLWPGSEEALHRHSPSQPGRQT